MKALYENYIASLPTSSKNLILINEVQFRLEVNKDKVLFITEEKHKFYYPLSISFIEIGWQLIKRSFFRLTFDSKANVLAAKAKVVLIIGRIVERIKRCREWDNEQIYELLQNEYYSLYVYT